MHPALTTSSYVAALIRGFVLSLLVVGALWLLDLPLDPKFVAVVLVVLTISSAITLYDGSRAEASSAQPIILMKNVAWNFSTSSYPTLDDFIAAVSSSQGAGSSWNPQGELPVAHMVSIHFATFHDDDSAEKTVALESDGQSAWTQATLLFALHSRLREELKKDALFLGDRTFFEGLIPADEQNVYLQLGS